MKVAVVGCVHGQLDRAYAAIARSNVVPQLVLMCGDFQAFRTPADLLSFSAPPRFREMGDFHAYFTGLKRAPYLTIVIGGNHEASNYLSSMPDGGWLCENIWYLGNAGIVSVDGLVVAGLSGIYYEPDYLKPHFEGPLFAKDLIKTSKTDALFSVFHTREVDVERLGKLPPQLVDIMMTHDWPQGIEHYGDLAWLLRKKPFFAKDVAVGELGNPATTPLLSTLAPQWWFSAHLHVRFRATYGDTEFLALDKCLNQRAFLEFVDVEPRHSSVDNAAFEGFMVKHLYLR